MVEVNSTIGQRIANICAIDAEYSAPGKHLGYGTAGFRANAMYLERACFRVGLVVGMRAKSVGRCGIMITASHNHHADNGVKIVEPDGSMLVQDWEHFSEVMVNTDDLDTHLSNLDQLNFSDMVSPAQIFGVEPITADHASNLKVFLAMDTRESSPVLMAAIKRALECL